MGSSNETMRGWTRATSVKLGFALLTSLLAMSSSAHAHDGSRARETLHVSAQVVEACVVGTRSFVRDSDAGLVDVTCYEAAAPLIEQSELIELEDGAHVVVSTVNF